MKKIALFFITIVISVSNYIVKADEPVEEQSVDVVVQAQQHAKINILLGVVGSNSYHLSDIVTLIKKCFEFSGQCNVAVQSFDDVSKKDIIDYFKKGYPLAIFINNAEAGQALEWRLYDTSQTVMLTGRKYYKRGGLLRGWAYNLADILWKELTGQPGFFSTKIAYCKNSPKNQKKRSKQIYCADYDGSNEELLIATPTINVAPRWNRDLNNPLLFYSEYTNSNIRLMVVTMKGRKRVASNFDGLNMLPSFSQDGKKVIYCASRGDGSCHLYYYEKGIFKRLTHNSGNNVSPTLSDDGEKVFFCSDFQKGSPQIYCYDLKMDQLQKITDSGYCASPSYSEKTGKVAYSKIVKGTMQIFLYDIKTKVHTQITFDAGHKEECSWSPCGNYLLFSCEQEGKSRIAVLNLLTHKYRSITSEKDHCSYPAWSPIYAQFPVIM